MGTPPQMPSAEGAPGALHDAGSVAAACSSTRPSQSSSRPSHASSPAGVHAASRLRHGRPPGFSSTKPSQSSSSPLLQISGRARTMPSQYAAPASQRCVPDWQRPSSVPQEVVPQTEG